MTAEVNERLIRVEAKLDTMANDVHNTATTVAVQNGRLTSLELNQAARVAREEFADKVGDKVRNWIVIAIGFGTLIQASGFALVTIFYR